VCLQTLNLQLGHRNAEYGTNQNQVNKDEQDIQDKRLKASGIKKNK